MKIIKGQFNEAVVFTDNVEEKACEQVKELCNQEFVKESRIRIMPDMHAGAGCTIGTTMTIQDRIVPNLVGVDIGCGMHVSRIKQTNVEFAKLDKVIRRLVPSGMDVRTVAHEYNRYVELDALKCRQQVNLNRARLSIGTLGGGNHFIELNRDEADNLYLVIHSGSRNLGKQIAEYYQQQAAASLTHGKSKALVKELKAQGRHQEIQAELEKTKQKVNRNLACVTGELFDAYLNDMAIAQKFAEYNRKAIAKVIVSEMGFKVSDSFTTIHNYIDLPEMMLRKGAISAKAGEVVIIPMNMRDGSIIATGKGNPDWNCSAPHGAGRLMSRMQAKRSLKMEDFKAAMAGIYTTSVSRDTLDEAPDAYKPMAEIVANIQDTVEIQTVIKPLYNFKASDD